MQKFADRKRKFIFAVDSKGIDYEEEISLTAAVIAALSLVPAIAEKPTIRKLTEIVSAILRRIHSNLTPSS